jgi:hypothetical protein
MATTDSVQVAAERGVRRPALVEQLRDAISALATINSAAVPMWDCGTAQQGGRGVQARENLHVQMMAR